MNAKGFTLLEIMCSVSIMGIAGLLVNNFLAQPQKMTTNLLNDDLQAPVLRAADLMVQDLREADKTTIPWTLIPPDLPGPANDFTFQKIQYPTSSSTAAVSTTVHWKFSNGILTRTVGSSTTSMVTAGMDAPTQATPMIARDPALLDIIVIQLILHTPGTMPQVITRRVFIRN